MRWNRICLGQRFITVLLLVIGLNAYGCKDSVSVSEDVQVPLASLTITPGTLQPGFFSNTTNYTVNVSTAVINVTVTATPKDNTTTMTINGMDTNPGQGRVIPLSPSETTTNITIVLTNQNGTESSYSIIVRKVENTLSALTVTPPGTFPPPGFTPTTLDYQVDVSSGVSRVTVSATKLDPRALMSGAVNAGVGVATGTATIPLNGPGTDTLVSVTVAVPNSAAKTYTIIVHRALSGDNNLAALTVIPGTFNQLFNPATTEYIVDVTTDVEQVTMSATKSDPNAAMSGSLNAGPGISTDTKPITLGGAGSETSVVITVAAPDPNVIPKEYRITVKRAAPSSNANLSALEVSTGSSNHSVDLNTPPPYIVNVAFEVINVIVTATLEDTNATLTINGQGTSSGVPSAPITLGLPGSNTDIPISVIAPSGDQKDYPITVNRALLPFP